MPSQGQNDVLCQMQNVNIWMVLRGLLGPATEKRGPLGTEMSHTCLYSSRCIQVANMEDSLIV